MIDRAEEIRRLARKGPITPDGGRREGGLQRRLVEEESMPVAERTNCPVCDEEISTRAKKCRHCGEVLDARMRQELGLPGAAPRTGGKSKIAAGIFAILLGWFGVHKYYLGRVGQGLLYTLFFWTGIPALLGIIEGIIYLTMDDERFAQKYG